MDYSKLPRSSGDGMEFSSSNSSDGSSSEGSEESDSSQRINNSSTSTVKRQNLGNHVIGVSTGIKTNAPSKVFSVDNSRIDTRTQQRKDKGSPSGYPTLVKATQLEENSQVVKTRTKDAQLNSDLHAKPIQRQNSTNLLLQGSELPRLNNQLGLSLSSNDQLVSLAPPAVDLGFGDGLPKSTVVEQTAEFIDSQKVINDLEEHNSKLVEEKTKLSVQLGIQTKVIHYFNQFLIVLIWLPKEITPDCIVQFGHSFL